MKVRFCIIEAGACPNSAPKEQKRIAQGFSPGNGPLSRRDEMKVARHEMPGNMASRSPSRRVRYDRLARASYGLGRWQTPSGADHTVLCGTDHVHQLPRHFMPGYHHVVPPGQIHTRPFFDVHVQSWGGSLRKRALLQYSTTPRCRIRGRGRRRGRVRRAR
jgi:hypothetical protein